MGLSNIPFDGETLLVIPIPEKVKSQAGRNDLDKIIFLFGQWAITTYGVECLEMYYQISKERLWEPDWEAHMSEKSWVNKKEFSKALNMAKKYFKEKE